MKRVLNFENGAPKANQLHPMFRGEEWTAIRINKNANYNPDIVGNIESISSMQKGGFDAIWCAHDLCRIQHHQVIPTLKNMLELLKNNGFLLCMVFDIRKVAERINKGDWAEPIQLEKENAPAPIDMLYGPRAAIIQDPSLQFKTGFTARSLSKTMDLSGFSYIRLSRNGPRLYAWAQKGERKNNQARVEIHEENIYEMMKKRDEIDTEPTLPVQYKKL